MATTNFDRLHEAASSDDGHRSYGLADLPRPSRRGDFTGVFHIHGLLPETAADPAELILTDQDFGDYYMRRRVTSDFVYDAARIFHIVTVGYSLNDAPMRYLLNAIAGDQTHFPDLKTRYALVPVRSDDDYTAQDWKNRGIEPLCYCPDNQHEALGRWLNAWADSVPAVENDRWLSKRLKAMAKTPPDATPGDRSLFQYLIRRSTPQERATILSKLSLEGASLDWLDLAHEIIRQADR